LENLLRTEGNGSVEAADVEALASWDAKAQPSREIAFTPARVLMQDFTGVPAVVALAAVCDAIAQMGGAPAQIHPLAPADPVFDNEETGQAYPGTLVGTYSHTTMINGLGVLGWGVGGIEAESAMLGQPMSMLIPQVLGVELHGALPEGATATDLVLTVTQMLRERGVVGMFVEFFGDGLAGLPIADRATIGNMSPEFGSTCAIFPIDAETLTYLELSGRSAEQVALVEAYAKEQ